LNLVDDHPRTGWQRLDTVAEQRRIPEQLHEIFVEQQIEFQRVGVPLAKPRALARRPRAKQEKRVILRC
jgi:hypothetical protein